MKIRTWIARGRVAVSFLIVASAIGVGCTKATTDVTSSRAGAGQVNADGCALEGERAPMSAAINQPCVTGAIQLDLSGNGKTEPIEGAKVFVEGHEDISTVSGAGGTFALMIADVAPRLRLNGAVALAGEDPTDVGKRPFNLVSTFEQDGKKYAKRIPGLLFSGGRVLDIGKMTLAETGAIKGRVTLADGASSLGVDVYIPGTSFVAKAAEDGTFVIMYVPEGDYRLVYERDGYFLRIIPAVGVVSKEITLVEPVELATKDETQPDTTIATGPANVANSQTATFTFTSTKSYSDFVCKIDNGLYAPCATPFTIVSLGEGAHALSVASISPSGIRDDSAAVWNWTVDITPPLLVVESKPAAATNSTTAAFVFSLSDSSATIHCSLDDAEFQTCALSASFTDLAQGFHTMAVYASDSAGNKSSTRVLAWQIDSSAVNTVALQTPPTLTNATSATIAFTSNKSATFACAFDGANWQACSSPVTYTGLASGAHLLRVRATDLTSQVEDSPLEVAWTVDANAPDVPSPTAVAGNLTNDATPTLSWSASSIDTASYQLEVDITPSFNSTYLHTFAGVITTSETVMPQISDGRWYYRVRALDTAGNLSAWSTALNFDLDTQDPEVPVSSYLPDPFNDTRPTFAWGAAADAVRYRLMVAADATFATPVIDKSDLATTSYQPVAPLSPGVVFWKVAAIDAAGNESNFCIAKYFTIDTSAPSTPVAGTVASPSNDTTPTMSWSAVVGAAAYNVQVSTSSTFASMTINDASITALNYTAAALTDNIYYWRVAAIDSAGNKSGYSAPQSFIIDTVAPTAPVLTAYTPNPTNDLTPTLVWSNPGGGAVSYDVWIKQGATTLISQTGVTETSYTPAAALPVATITWQVRAKDAAGNVGAYATASSLTLSSAATWKLRFLKERTLVPKGTYDNGNYDHLRYTGPTVGLTLTVMGSGSQVSAVRFTGNRWVATGAIGGYSNYFYDGHCVGQDDKWIVSSYAGSAGFRLRIFDHLAGNWVAGGVPSGWGGSYIMDCLVHDDRVELLFSPTTLGGLWSRTYDLQTAAWSNAVEVVAAGTDPRNFYSSEYWSWARNSFGYDNSRGRLGLMLRLGTLGVWRWYELVDSTWVAQGSCSTTGSGCNVSGSSVANAERLTYVGGIPVMVNSGPGKRIAWSGTSFETYTSTDKRYRLKDGGGVAEEDTFLEYFNGTTTVEYPIEDDNGTVLTNVFSYEANRPTTLSQFGFPIARIKNLLTTTAEIAVSVGLNQIDVTPGIGKYTSSAFTSSGTPRIAYYDSAARKLKLAERPAESWTVGTIDTGTDVGKFASIALKSDNKGVISYYDANVGDLKVATEGASSWSTYAVDSGGDVGQYTSIAARSDDNPVVAYYDVTNGNLKMATFDGSAWTTQTVASTGDVGQYASLALNASNQPRVAYYDVTNGDLMFASWNGTTWDSTVVDSTGDVGQYANLVLKSTGDPMIAYYDATNGDLKFAEWSGSAWVVTTMRSTGDVGTHASLTRDANNNPHIIYYDATNKDLIYGNRDTNWAWRTVDGDDSTSQDKGQYGSLRINPSNGAPSASYFDAVEGGVSFVEGMVLY